MRLRIKPPRKLRRRQAFALISTIVLMLLLALLSVGLLTVASTQTRISEKALLTVEAKAQARLALEVAIGTLQGELGPDQRVSANSGILIPGTEAPAGSNPYILGTWNSWDNYLNRANSSGVEINSTYNEGRNALFRRWLISDPDKLSLTNLSAGTRSLGLDKTMSNSKRVLLLGGGTLGYVKKGGKIQNNKEIYAGLIQVEDTLSASKNEVTKGAANDKYIAWWVSAENQKVRINVPKFEDSQQSDLTAIARGAWDTPGPDLSVLGLESVISGGGNTSSQELAKIVSYDTATLGSSGSLQATKAIGDVYHDVSLYSQGLLSDVKFGGLKKDLNILLSKNTLPEGMKPLSNKDIGLRAVNGEDGSPIVADRPISSWNQLHLWANMWDSNSSNSTADKSNSLVWEGGVPMTTVASDSSTNLQIMDNKQTYLRHPILLKYYAFVGLQYVKHGNVHPIRGGWITPRLSVIPVFVWWNPYNVPMKMSGTNGAPWGSYYGQHRFMPMVASSNIPFSWGLNNELLNNYSESLLVPFSGNSYYNRQIADFGASFRETSKLLPSGVAQKGNPSTLNAGEIKIFAQPLATSIVHGNEVYKAKETGAELNVDNFALKEGWSQDPTQTSAYAVNWFDGVRYEYLDGSGYESATGPALASVKFAESLGELNFTPENHVLSTQYTDEFDKTSKKLGTFVMVSGLMDPKMIGQKQVLSGKTTPDPKIFTQVMPSIFNINWGAWEKPLIEKIKLPSSLWLDNKGPDENLIKQGYYGRPLEDSTFIAYYGISAKWGLNPIVGAYPSNSDYRAKTWQHSSPLFWGGQMVKASELARSYSPYQFEVKQANSDFAPITISNILSNDGTKLTAFGGPGAEQVNKIVASELPLQQPYSLAGFSSFRLTPGWYKTDSLPKTAKRFAYQSGVPGVGIGNSFADPMIPADKVFKNQNISDDEALSDFWDHGFLINDSLWDSWYTSSFASRPKEIGSSAKEELNNVVKEAFSVDTSQNKSAMANKRFVVDGQGSDVNTIVKELTDAEGYKKSAKYLTIPGAFNVNSVSEKAWESILKGLKNRKLLHNENGKPSEINNQGEALFARFGIASSDKSHVDDYGSVGIINGISSGEAQAWSDLRKINDSQLKQLASEMVKEVKKRGPFLNMAEFINRRLETGEMGVKGALQAAIDNSNINSAFSELSETIVSPKVSYPHQEAAKGSAYTAAPGYLIQSDVLAVLGNILTTRDDTFTIRAYGEITNKAGKILSRAWCEAIVQRSIYYVDPTNAPETAAIEVNPTTGATTNTKLTAINKAFGRKFNIVSFKWLSPEEV